MHGEVNLENFIVWRITHASNVKRIVLLSDVGYL